MADKKTDLAGPGISTYEEVEKILPTQYQSILTPRETQIAITAAKRYIEDGPRPQGNSTGVRDPSRSR